MSLTVVKNQIETLGAPGLTHASWYKSGDVVAIQGPPERLDPSTMDVDKMLKCFHRVGAEQALGPHVVTQGYDQFEKVGSAVEDGRAQLGLVAVESALVGKLPFGGDTNEAMIARRNLAVLGDPVEVDITFSLFGLIGVSGIKRVMLQKSALVDAQCSDKLRELNLTARHVEHVDCHDGLEAAAELAKSYDTDTVVLAASNEGLKIPELVLVEPDMQNDGAKTRFAVITRAT